MHMAISQAKTSTERGAGYIQRLCKHWSHRFPVEMSEGRGVVHFSDEQTIRFYADAGNLNISISAEGDEQLGKLEEIVAAHLHGFANHETLSIEWKRSQEVAS